MKEGEGLAAKNAKGAQISEALRGEKQQQKVPNKLVLDFGFEFLRLFRISTFGF